ncbi:MAG: GGDEF domain-containing protein [Vulcanimicrobiaceae bacterium]
MKGALLRPVIGESRRANLCREIHLASLEIVAAARDSSLAVLSALGTTGFAFCKACDSMVVFVPDGDELTCVYNAGDRGAYFIGTRISRLLSPSAVARAARSGARVVADERGARLIPGDRCALALPMCDASGRVHGVVYWSTTRESLDHPDLLADSVDVAALAYILACERESDRSSATFDALTGLHAPRAFRVVLGETIAKRVESSSPLSLWFIDTDHFKSVNDRFGHAVGDCVLQHIASLLQASLTSPHDIAARNGGDEFCALLWRTHKSQAFLRAEQFCRAVRAHDFLTGIAMSVSIGVATFPDDAASASELLEAADAAMYHSKRQGRDRVSFRSHAGSYQTVTEMS